MARTGAADTQTRPNQQFYEVPKRLSHSQVSKVHPFFPWSCPRQYAYQYLLRLPFKPSPSLAVGDALDEAANAYFWTRINEPVRPVEEAATIAFALGSDVLKGRNEETPELFGENLEQYQELFEQAWAAFMIDQGKIMPLAVQEPVSLSVVLPGGETKEVVGVADRIDPGGVIVDHKFSGSPRWNQAGEWSEEYVAPKRDQLVLYWLARRRDEDEYGEGRLVVTYHKLGNKKAQVRTLDLRLDMELGMQALKRVVEASQIIARNQFRARPGKACGFCSFVEDCRKDEEARGQDFLTLVEVPF